MANSIVRKGVGAAVRALLGSALLAAALPAAATAATVSQSVTFTASDGVGLHAYGIDREPAVQLWLGNGSREALAAGRFTRAEGSTWPIPRTTWKRLFLDAAKAGGGTSLNDGSLRAAPAAPALSARQSYPAISSLPTATDPHTTSAIGAGGADPFFAAVPALTRMDTIEPSALTYTTPPFTEALDVAGPASLDVFLSSTAPEADIHAVIADVWPDGRAFPVGAGRLRTSFPEIDRARSVVDKHGEVVQPYNLFRERKPAAPGQIREYHLEFWPLGNRFDKGHRLRLYLVGTSGYQLPSLPGINTVALGAATPSRLLVPVLPRGRDAGARGAGGDERRSSPPGGGGDRRSSPGDPSRPPRTSILTPRRGW